MQHKDTDSRGQTGTCQPIDGIRLSEAKYIRYRHNEYSQLEKLVETHHKQYEQVIIVTESIFSMDGDEADLPRLIKLKQKYPNILLYVDEAHAVVSGEQADWDVPKLTDA